MRFYTLLLTTSIFLFLYSFADCQNLVKEGNQWNVKFQSFSSPEIVTSLTRIGGDTLLNDTVYHKIFTTLDTFGTNWVLNDIAIREDSTGKVHTRRYGDESESTEYDFNLQLNDIFLFSSYCPLEVFQIDSVTLNNGERRKQIHLKVPGGSTNFGPRWVEGIGDLNGGLFGNIGYCITDVGGDLLCFYENDELIYPEAPTRCFDELIVFVRNGLPSDISIYPNPISDVLKIKFLSTVLKKISIVDIRGVKVYEDSFAPEVDVSILAPGTYIILLEDSVGTVYADKLVKVE